VIHGLGGLGKSSLAARLCDRLPQFERVVWLGALDTVSLVKTLAETLKDAALREQLQNNSEELKFRLHRVLESLVERGAKPFLLVWDDFEENLEAREQAYILKPSVVEVFQAVVWAIRKSGQPHRLMITSRYDFALDEAVDLFRQPMEALQGADLRKKCSRLPGFKVAVTDTEKSIQEKVQQLADGNPRLLEKLDQQVLVKSEIEATEILNLLQIDPSPLRQEVLTSKFWQGIDATLRKLLSRGLIFNLPVPREAFETVVQPSQASLIDCGIGLGLLEVSPEGDLRVPRILQLESPTETRILAARGAQFLYRLWWEGDCPISGVQQYEIVYLAVKGQEQEIAAIVGDQLAAIWVSNNQFAEAKKLCQFIVQLGEDYRILSTLARAEKVLGETQQAIGYFRRSLELCPENDLSRKVAILNNMAQVIADQGDIERAMKLWQQVLDIDIQIGEIDVKGATLNNMAGVMANCGNIERALQLWRQSLNIAEQIGNLRGKATTLGNMARVIAEQGNIEHAQSLWQQVLDIQEEIGDVKGKAVTFNNMAQVIANQGDIEHALKLLQQSLDIKEEIGDVKGKATTLNNMAQLISVQGDIERALHRWQQSLDICEQIGDLSGKATTLNNMARVYFQQGNQPLAITLTRQAAQALVNANDYIKLCTALRNLGVMDDVENSQIYFAQTVWLSLYIQVPLTDSIALFRSFYQRIPLDDELASLLAVTAGFYCRTRGERHPRLEELLKTCEEMLVNAAAGQGVKIDGNHPEKTRKSLGKWFKKSQLNNPDMFLPKLIQRLEEIVEDNWLFDRSKLVANTKSTGEGHMILP
jgi:tetratricopeptide (TPR) repeat protein